jgi:RNA polymerase sigma-70 factor (ECF subfamily)
MTNRPVNLMLPVTLSNLLDHATMLSAPLDETDLAPLRASLFGRLRASGWAPSGHPRGAPIATESDAALLTAFVRGEAAAFDVLFDRHAARLNGYARRWLRGADAADAVQDAFIVLFEKASTLLERDDVNVGGYLFVTVRYKVLRALAASAARETPVAEPGANEPSPEDDGFTALLRREDAGRLAGVLERACNPLEQHVVMLDLEDRSDAEIVSTLGIAPGHVRVVRHRALAKLRRALQDEAS